jgi:hypothetical protein
MVLDLAGLNWIAIVVATFVYFALGAVMFAPFTPIGRAWVAASGYESPTSGTSSTNAFYIVPIVTSFVSVLTTALLAQATGTDTLTEGVTLGLLVGIGYAAVILLNTAAFEFAKPNRTLWGVIDATYHVIGLVIAAVILVLLP